VKDIIFLFSIFVLPALYLSAFFFGLRQILRTDKDTFMKGALIFGLVGILFVVSFISLILFLAMAGGYNH